ncbi:MAG: class I SAM-dependent methyltransferase [Bacteroidota bacterium]
MTADKLTGNFNSIAPYYDALAHLVFGQTLEWAQASLLNKLQGSNTILILGGGSGWILEEIFRQEIKAEKIIYIDSSKQMISLSKDRLDGLPNSFQTSVNLIHGSHLDIPEQSFDAIITFFFLDLFQEDRLGKLLADLKTKLHKGGIWLVCDFFNENRSWWKGLLISTMYTFFGLMSGLGNRKLPPIKVKMEENELTLIEEKKWKKGLVKALAYKKSGI